MVQCQYHPLIGCEDDFVPMFRCPDERSAKDNFKFYLRMTTPGFYRLCSVKGIHGAADCSYMIHCPYCGKIMRAVAAPTDDHVRGLYTCDNCQSKYSDPDRSGKSSSHKHNNYYGGHYYG